MFAPLPQVNPDFPDLIGVFGRLHPLLVHLPIGLLVGLLALELAAGAAGAMLPRKVVSVLAWFAALSAALAALAGYTLSREDGYGGDFLDLHLRLGLGIAACAILMAAVHGRAGEGTRTAGMRAYRVLLLLSVALLVPAGHLGSTIAHGDGYLTEPLRRDVRSERKRPSSEPVLEGAGKRPRSAENPGATGAAGEKPPQAAKTATVSYARDVAPVLAARCGACHGESKRKGGLSLKDPESILEGSWQGPVLVASRPEESELVRRLRLPIDAEDHMPPEGKPQPTEDEIALLERWIAAGAPFDAQSSGTAPASGTAEPRERATSDGDRDSTAAGSAGDGMAVPLDERPDGPAADASGIPPADETALAALREKLVRVEPLAKGSNLLRVDFSAAGKTADADAAGLLEPVLAQTGDLSFARCGIGDASLQVAARMPNLVRLDVRETAVTDAGVAALAGHERLAELVLPRTKLSDASVNHLLALPALRRVFLWNSGVTLRGIARLRSLRPDLLIEAGGGDEAKGFGRGSKEHQK